MIRMYAGGWNCFKEDIANRIAKNIAPEAVYQNYEEAVKNAYNDAEVECDEHIFFVYDNGEIVEFEEW